VVETGGLENISALPSAVRNQSVKLCWIMLFGCRTRVRHPFVQLVCNCVQLSPLLQPKELGELSVVPKSILDLRDDFV